MTDLPNPTLLANNWNYEKPVGNFLRPNGLGGYIIRQSDLSSWSWCPIQKFYGDRAKSDPAAPQGLSLSATTFGSVIHRTLMLMEQWRNEGRENVLEDALRDFEYYWQLNNLEQLDLRIDIWIGRQTWSGLMIRGRELIREYYDLLTSDRSDLLALEYQFAVPIGVNGRLHTLTGTIDRLSIRRYYQKPFLSADDFKTGKKKPHLRYHQQFSAYAYATTREEFWRGWPESGMTEALETFDESTLLGLERLFSSWGYALHNGTHVDLPLASRKGRWIDLQEVKFSDGGWRHERDYARLAMAIDGYVESCEAEIYPLNVDGEHCKFCSFRDICGGLGLPNEEEGRP